MICTYWYVFRVSLKSAPRQGRSQGVARGGRGHHWPKLGHPFGHPTQNCRFCPFFFLTRNTFIKKTEPPYLFMTTSNGRLFRHFSLASAPGAGQTSVERNRNQMSFSRTTVIWWDAVRLYVYQQNKLSCPVSVTVLTAHTLQLYVNIRRTLYIFILNNVCKKLWAYKVLSSVKSRNYQKGD